MNEPSRPVDESAEDGQNELLVAYLDGELDVAQTQDVERRLAEEPQLRRRLHELQKTWDVLDSLPQASTANTFTKSTIELVAREATREIRRERRRRPETWIRWSAWTAAGLLAIWGGFQFMRGFQTAPARQLARDLRVIENMELYRAIDSLEFLKELERAGLFVNEEPSHD